MPAYHAGVDTFRHGEVDLAYDDFGPRDAEPLLFLDGLGSSRRQWDPFVPALVDSHRVFTMDHRGHGDSSHAPATSYTLTHYGADAAAFAEAVLERPAVLVGQSLGGAVAHFMACSRPELVRGVFLVDPPLLAHVDGGDGQGVSGFFPGVRQALREAQAHSATAEQYAAALRSLPAPAGQAAIGDVLSDEVLLGMAEEQLRFDPEVFTPAIEGTLFHGLEASRRISCAVTVLRADPDRMAEFTADDERRFRAVNPHADVHVVPGAGHVVHADAPEEFTSRLAGFLRSLD